MGRRALELPAFPLGLPCLAHQGRPRGCECWKEPRVRVKSFQHLRRVEAGEGLGTPQKAFLQEAEQVSPSPVPVCEVLVLLRVRPFPPWGAAAGRGRASESTEGAEFRSPRLPDCLAPQAPPSEGQSLRRPGSKPC